MSIVRTSPAWALPGWIQSPGLAASKVTVIVARTALAQTAPVEASTPLGTSTLTTGAPEAFAASIASATVPRGSPAKPVPSSASTIANGVRRPLLSTSPRDAVPESICKGGSPGRRRRFSRASPLNSSSGPAVSTTTSRPASRSRRAATSPSPPLLPLPQSTATGPSGASCSTARATPTPARSIRSSEGTLRSSIAQRSMARIASASGSGRHHSGRAPMSCDPNAPACATRCRYSTVTVFARLRG